MKYASETEKREQRQQVEVAQRERPAPVDERQQEQHAQRQPDVERVDVPAERPGVAPRHRPRHLEAGPLFEHPPARVGDDDLADFLALAGEVAHLPAARAFQVGAAVGAGVAWPARGASSAAAPAISRTSSEESRRPAGGTIDGATGTGVSELVAAAVVVAAVVVRSRR